MKHVVLYVGHTHVQAILDQKKLTGLAGGVRYSRLPYSTYLYLDFHLFHEKAKRTQQGDLLLLMASLGFKELCFCKL